MQKKKDAPSVAQPAPPPLEPATTQETTPDPIATSSQVAASAPTPDTSAMPEPNPEPEALLTAVDDTGLVAEQLPTPIPEPARTLEVEPAHTLVLEPKPEAPPKNAPVPDPSEIAGLDSPIIAADTLDEDEAESPTVIISRDPEDKE